MSKMSQKAADALADAAPEMLDTLELIAKLATCPSLAQLPGLPMTRWKIQLTRISVAAEIAIKEAHKL